MSYIFNIVYDAFTDVLSVTMNGQDYIRQNYTSFAQYPSMPFEEWAGRLAKDCWDTVISPFDVRFAGSELHAGIIEALLQSGGFQQNFQRVQPAITAQHRLDYALSSDFQKLPELNARFHNGGQLLSLDLPAVLVYRGNPGLRIPAKVQLCEQAAFAVKEVASSDQAALIVGTAADISAIPRKPYGSMICGIVPGAGSARVAAAEQGICVLTGDVGECLKLWYREMMLPKLFKGCANRIPKAQLDVLLAKQPTAYLSGVPTSADRVKVGESRNVFLRRFPPNAVCNLSTSDHVDLKKVQLGSHGGEQTALNMTMAAEGTAQIILRLRDHPNIPEKAYSFRVYQDHPVKDIRDVKVSKNDPIMVGDAFEISFAVSPANATNLSALQWQLSAPNVLSIDPGSGTRRRFTAARAGQCDVTIRIDQVSYVQRITVYPAAERLGGKTSSMCVKENDLNARWNLSIEPAGSRGGHIVFTSLDRAVVEVDSSGRLSPRAPGRTEIVAELLDHRHQVKATRRLDIEIQPQFSNPDIVQFIGVSALIITAAFTLYGSEYGFVSGIAALLVFGISFFNSTSRSVKIGDVVLGCVTLFLLGILYGMF